jgi:hypothetical protein
MMTDTIFLNRAGRLYGVAAQDVKERADWLRMLPRFWRECFTPAMAGPAGK